MSQSLPVFILLMLFAPQTFSAMPDIVDAAPPVPEKSAPIPFTPSRGQLLYELHCISCHESVLHIRSNRKVSSLAELQHQVIHWSGVLKLSWQNEEITDVTQYLNTHFYKLEPK